jgi:hypothetical protein
MTDRIKEIEERLERASPGPWKELPEEVGRAYIRIRGTRLGCRYKIANVVCPVDLDREIEETRANAQFIAHAPDDIRYLLAELTKAREENAELRSQLAVRDRAILRRNEIIEANNGQERTLTAELAECRGRLEAKRVCLCGSSRFVDIMAVCGWLIERDEHAITMGLHLLPMWYPDCPDHHLAEHEGCVDEQDALHLKKISLADEIFVVNFKGYIGESTKREIEYAKSLGRPIRWFTSSDHGTYYANSPTKALLKALAHQWKVEVK